MDGRTRFLDSADAVTELVGRIPDEDWSAYGLGDWDVRALVGHTSRALTTVETYIARPAVTIDCPDAVSYYVRMADLPKEEAGAVTARGVEAGRQMGDDPAAYFAECTKRARAALAPITQTDEYLLTTIVGGMRLTDYLETRTFELIAHGYDIARATGLTFTPHPQAAADTAVLAARIGIALGHSEALILSLLGRNGPGDRSVLSRL